MPHYVLYAAANVPSPRRSMMCLVEKSIPFEIRWLNLALMDQKSPEYLKLNPTGMVPTLLDGDHTVFESNTINEYLEERHPEPALVPKDAWGRAQMRMWFAFENDWAKPFRDAVYETFAKDRIRSTGMDAEQVKAEIAKRTPNAVYGRIAEKLLLEDRNEGVVADRIDLLMEKMDLLNTTLSDGRPWLCGENFSLADICMAPRLEMFPAIGITDLYERFPHIARLAAAVKQRPSWAASAIVPEAGETSRFVEP